MKEGFQESAGSAGFLCSGFPASVVFRYVRFWRPCQPPQTAAGRGFPLPALLISAC